MSIDSIDVVELYAFTGWGAPAMELIGGAAPHELPTSST
jgi:hypothetical protein